MAALETLSLLVQGLLIYVILDAFSSHCHNTGQRAGGRLPLVAVIALAPLAFAILVVVAEVTWATLVPRRRARASAFGLAGMVASVVFSVAVGGPF